MGQVCRCDASPIDSARSARSSIGRDTAEPSHWPSDRRRTTATRGRPSPNIAHGVTVDGMDLPELLVTDAGEWHRWLDAHHAGSPGVWLVLARKGTVEPTRLSYDEALDEAIGFGWIDGQLGRRDGTTFRRRFTPRRARSPWSQRNAAIVERLIATGRMQPSGDVEVRQAIEDGRWEAAYAGQASMEVPADLTAALQQHPEAAATFETLTGANRTPSSTGSEAPRSPRPARGDSSSSSRCWPTERRSTPRPHDHPGGSETSVGTSGIARKGRHIGRDGSGSDGLRQRLQRELERTCVLFVIAAVVSHGQ